MVLFHLRSFPLAALRWGGEGNAWQHGSKMGQEKEKVWKRQEEFSLSLSLYPPNSFPSQCPSCVPGTPTSVYWASEMRREKEKADTPGNQEELWVHIPLAMVQRAMRHLLLLEGKRSLACFYQIRRPYQKETRQRHLIFVETWRFNCWPRHREGQKHRFENQMDSVQSQD